MEVMDSENKAIVTNLWQECEPYIRKLCTYKLKSLPDCIDDCIQDVFLDLSDALTKGKEIKHPKAWLVKVANNKIIDIYSQTKKEKERLISLDSGNINDFTATVTYDEYFSIEDKQLSLLEDTIINMLNEDERHLLQDRYNLHKPISIIAKEHNTTENNIYQKLFRLKQKTEILIKKTLNE